MLNHSVIGAVLVAATVIIHAVGTTLCLRILGRRRTALEEAARARTLLQILIGTIRIWQGLIQMSPEKFGTHKADTQQ